MLTMKDYDYLVELREKLIYTSSYGEQNIKDLNRVIDNVWSSIDRSHLFCPMINEDCKKGKCMFYSLRFTDCRLVTNEN